MLNKTMKQMIASSVAAGLLGIAGTTAHAAFLDVVYSSDFSGESVGAIPQGWVVERSDNGTWGVNGDQDYAFTEDDMASTTMFGRSIFHDTLDNGAAASSLADYRVAATVRLPDPDPDNNSFGGAGGIAGRFTDDQNYYHLRLNTFDDALQLYVVSDGFTLLDSVATSAEAGVLELIMDGTTITGNLYDHDTGDLLQAVGASDATHASGTFGLRGVALASNFYTEDVVVAVPEPGSLALLAAGGIMMMVRRRRD